MHHSSLLSGHSVNVCLGKLLVTGGEGKDCYLNDIWSSEDGNTWAQEVEENGVIWCPRKGHAAAVLNDKLYIMGGVTTTSSMNSNNNYCNGCPEDGEDASGVVQHRLPTQITTTLSSSSSPPQLPSSPTFAGCTTSSSSPLNLVYLRDCFVLSYTSEL